MASRRSYASMVSGKNNAGPQSGDSNESSGNTKSGDKDQEDKSYKPMTPSEPKHKMSYGQENRTSNHRDNSNQNHKQPNSKPDTKNSHQRGRSSSPTIRHHGKYQADEYMRRPDYIPRTRGNANSPSRNGDIEQHYVLTLLVDQSLHDYMTALRKKHFPPAINRLEAHVTLFHALPGSKLESITSDIESVCAKEKPFEIVAEEAMSPKNVNVLVNASSPRHAIEGVQKMLREKWSDFLSRQDSGGMRPHWTVANKIDDEEKVKKVLETVKGEFERRTGTVKGLVLWRYEKGWWKDRKAFEFGG